MLREAGPGNAVASPVAVAAALGMVHAGVQGAAEREIEALFGSQNVGPRGLKLRLPALLQQLAPRQSAGAAGSPPPSFVMAGRVWMDRRRWRQPFRRATHNAWPSVTRPTPRA